MRSQLTAALCPMSPLRICLNLNVPLGHLAVDQPAVLRAFLLLAASGHSEHFPPRVFRRINGEQKNFIRIGPSVRIDAPFGIHLYDVDHEHLRVRLIRRDEMVKRDPVVVDAAEAEKSTGQFLRSFGRGEPVSAPAALLLWYPRQYYPGQVLVPHDKSRVVVVSPASVQSPVREPRKLLPSRLRKGLYRMPGLVRQKLLYRLQRALYPDP